MAIVVVEQAGGRIVGDVQIEASVFVVVEPEDAETVITVGIDAELLGYIGEGAVSVVVIETIAGAF